MEDNKPEYRKLLAYLRFALSDNLFTADSRKLKQAIKDGACSISEAQSGIPAKKPG
jgi:hypothetical protein